LQSATIATKGRLEPRHALGFQHAASTWLTKLTLDAALGSHGSITFTFRFIGGGRQFGVFS
jgi:hypothetical protein